MIATAPSHTAVLKASVGFSAHSDLRRAALEAAEIALSGMGGSRCQLGLVLTAGLGEGDPVPDVKRILGDIGVAGGGVAALLVPEGIVSRGAVVVTIAPDGDAASGTVAVPARDAGEAGGRAARIVLAGWPFRLRYPRGLGLAFAAAGSPLAFLETWREFMGPKMRTVCAVVPGPVYGGGGSVPAASVACLEASYATGLGYAEGFMADECPDAERLVQGAAEATTTALKRLDERSGRLVLVQETVARAEALGIRLADEWSRVQSAAGDRVPCVGWLCERVAGYGRGIHPAEDPRAFIAAAIGDPPAAPIA